MLIEVEESIFLQSYEKDSTNFTLQLRLNRSLHLVIINFLVAVLKPNKWDLRLRTKKDLRIWWWRKEGLSRKKLQSKLSFFSHMKEKRSMKVIHVEYWAIVPASTRWVFNEFTSATWISHNFIVAVRGTIIRKMLKKFLKYTYLK